MSVKEQLAEAIAALPETLSMEEAVEWLYRAFQHKRDSETTPGPRRVFGAMQGQARVDDAFFEPLPEDELRAWES